MNAMKKSNDILIILIIRIRRCPCFRAIFSEQLYAVPKRKGFFQALKEVPFPWIKQVFPHPDFCSNNLGTNIAAEDVNNQRGQKKGSMQIYGINISKPILVHPNKEQI